MSPGIATALCLALMAACYWLDRDRARVSLALWIPMAWLAICASRTVGEWLAGSIGKGMTAASLEEGGSTDAAIFAAMVVAGIAVLVARRRRVGRILLANGPLLFFLFYCLLSIGWSDFSMVAFKRWIKELGDLTMVLIVLTDPKPAAALKRFLTWPGFVLVPLSILLIRYYPSLGRDYSDWNGEAYNVGVATGKNGLGYVCLIFGLGAVWSILSAWKRRSEKHANRQLLASLVLLVLTLWVFHMAHSATSFGCFFIGTTLLLIARRPSIRRSPVIVHCIVAGILFVVVYGLFLNPQAGLTDVVGRDATLTGRTRIWEDALKLTVNPVIGAGYESFWMGNRLEAMWLANGEHLNQAHNGYLEVYLDLGWVGLTLVAAVMLWGYGNAVRILRSAPLLGSLKIAFFVVAAIYNCTEHAFRELHPVWLMFLLAVVAIPPSLRQEFQ